MIIKVPPIKIHYIYINKIMCHFSFCSKLQFLKFNHVEFLAVAPFSMVWYSIHDYTVMNPFYH